MNIFNRVTLQFLKKNRTRTLVTIIGIVLSATMFTAVTTFIGSLQTWMLRTAVNENGDWHVAAYDQSEDQVEALRGDSRTESVFYGQSLGFAPLTSEKKNAKPYLYLMGADDTFFTDMPVNLTDGRLPEAENEVLIPDHLALTAGVRYALGETLTLSLGERVYPDGVTERNNLLMPDYQWLEGETLQADKERTLKVVGFYQSPGFEASNAPGYTLLTVADTSPASDASFVTYCRMSHPRDTEAFVKDLRATHAGSVTDTNSDVLMFQGVSEYGSFYRVLYSIGALLSVLILFGSVSLIYNAFSISVNERIKQYGLLSSIGATKRQLARSVRFEAWFLSLISIPIGILCGIAGIGITLLCLKSAISSFMFHNQSGATLQLSVSPAAILIAAAITLITVQISAWIPSRRATKVTAIEAIRQSSEVTNKAKPVKTAKLTYRFFGLEGMLARKHFKRNRRKYRTTVVSLFMSVVLFISASAFCMYLKQSVGTVFSPAEYDLVYHFSDLNTDAQACYDKTKTLPNVKQSSFLYASIASVDVKDLALTKEYTEYLGKRDQLNLYLFGVDEETYRAYLQEHHLDEETYMSVENPQGILWNQISGFDYDKEQQIALTPLSDSTESFSAIRSTYNDDGEVADEKRFALNVTVSKDDPVFGCRGYLESPDALLVMYPMETLVGIFGEDAMELGTFSYTTDDHIALFESLDSMLASAASDGFLHDVVQTKVIKENIILVMNVFSYGFIVLISLIAVANVFNTISTNISLRRREFAMLKSVGMTKKGFRKMMNYECLLYGTKALGYGLPASLGIVYLIYLSFDAGYKAQFYVPLVPFGIAVLSVFAVVFTTMLYAMRKLKMDNPIEALRNESV